MGSIIITDPDTQQRGYLTEHKNRSGGVCEGAADMAHLPHPATDLVVDLIDRNKSNNLNPANFRALCRSVAQKRTPGKRFPT